MKNNYFIDTIELTYHTTFEYITEKLGTVPKKCVKKGEFYYPTSLEANRSGIDMRTRKCSKGERHRKGENYKIVLRIATGKIPYFKDEVKHVEMRDDLDKMIYYVNEFIKFRMPDLDINDFELTRIDITNDIHKVPETVIKEYIMLMRRMFVPDKFELNEQLEKNTKDFRREDFFNALMKKGNTSIAEFVVYNKARAAIDQDLTGTELEYYKNTMRLELRCYKSYIRKMADETTTIEILRHMFERRSYFIEREFYRIFDVEERTQSFLNIYWLKKYIKRSIDGKPKHKKYMIELSTILDRDSLPNITDAQLIYCDDHCSSLGVMNWFNDIHISPVTIKNKDYPFLQSLSSALGFNDPTPTDTRLYEYLLKKTRNRKFYLNASDNYYEFEGVPRCEQEEC